MNETTTTIVGRIITRVDRRTVTNGSTVVNFRVASNQRRYDQSTDSWRDGDSLYARVTCWRKLGENVHASFRVGDPIIVHGRLFTRSYEKDGREQTAVEMHARAVGPDLTHSTAVVTRTKRSDGPAEGTGSALDAATAPPRSEGTPGDGEAPPRSESGVEAGDPADNRPRLRPDHQDLVSDGGSPSRQSAAVEAVVGG